MKKRREHFELPISITRALFALVVVVTVGFMAWQVVVSPNFMLLGEIVPRVSTSQKVVALAFDDGPLPKHTEETLTILRKHRVQATFFVIGKEARKHQKQLREIVAASHAVGNHSYSHIPLVLTTPKNVAQEIESTDDLIRAAGYQGTIPFRAPYGTKLISLPWYLARHNRVDVSRDVLPVEGRSRSARQITQDVVNSVQPGSIILLHAMYDHTASSRAALPSIINKLHSKGYRFVTVPELLQIRQQNLNQHGII